MRFDSYLINSPSFPVKEDFERFSAWCEWGDSEEINYIKALCDSENEFEQLVIGPYENGKETYYPIVDSDILPDHTYLFVKVVIAISNTIEVMGYVSIVLGEVVALTVFSDDGSGVEIDFYRSDRLVAEDENPVSIDMLSKRYSMDAISNLMYKSNCRLSNGVGVSGMLKL